MRAATILFRVAVAFRGSMGIFENWPIFKRGGRLTLLDEYWVVAHRNHDRARRRLLRAAWLRAHWMAEPKPFVAGTPLGNPSDDEDPPVGWTVLGEMDFAALEGMCWVNGMVGRRSWAVSLKLRLSDPSTGPE